MYILNMYYLHGIIPTRMVPTQLVVALQGYRLLQPLPVTHTHSVCLSAKPPSYHGATPLQVLESAVECPGATRSVSVSLPLSVRPRDARNCGIVYLNLRYLEGMLERKFPFEHLREKRIPKPGFIPTWALIP